MHLSVRSPASIEHVRLHGKRIPASGRGKGATRLRREYGGGEQGWFSNHPGRAGDTTVDQRNKGLTIRTAQQHGQKYVPRLLEHAQRGELDASFLATHRFSLEDGPRGYDIFKNKEEGCWRVVFTAQA